MVAIVRTNWAGTSGGPGLTQLALLGAAGGDWNPGGEQGAVDAVRTFWNSLVGLLPNELTLTVSPVIDVYNTENGELIASHVAPTPPANVVGTFTGVYAMATGVKVNWNTNQIRFGHRVKGATFIVPIGSTAFNNLGVVDSVTRGTIQTAANTLRNSLAANSTPLAVWSRPKTVPIPRAGFATEVAASEVNEKTAVLRGRRD